MATKKRSTKKTKQAAKPKLGTGKRFAKLSGQLKRKGVRNPDALAASIGRKSLGKKKMAKLSAQGRKRAARRRGRSR